MSLPPQVHKTLEQLGVDQKDPKNMRLPDGLEIVEDYQSDYVDMERLVIPRSVKKLGNAAFALCSRLREVVFEPNS